FDRSGEISFYFGLGHAITVSGFISSPTVIVRDVSTSVDMTELRSTATSPMLLPLKLRHSLVRERRFIGRPEEAPASAGLRAGSQSPRGLNTKNAQCSTSNAQRLTLNAQCRSRQKVTTLTSSEPPPNLFASTPG